MQWCVVQWVSQLFASTCVNTTNPLKPTSLLFSRRNSIVWNAYLSTPSAVACYCIYISLGSTEGMSYVVWLFSNKIINNKIFIIDGNVNKLHITYWQARILNIELMNKASLHNYYNNTCSYIYIYIQMHFINSFEHIMFLNLQRINTCTLYHYYMY